MIACPSTYHWYWIGWLGVLFWRLSPSFTIVVNHLSTSAVPIKYTADLKVFWERILLEWVLVIPVPIIILSLTEILTEYGDESELFLKSRLTSLPSIILYLTLPQFTPLILTPRLFPITLLLWILILEIEALGWLAISTRIPWNQLFSNTLSLISTSLTCWASSGSISIPDWGTVPIVFLNTDFKTLIFFPSVIDNPWRRLLSATTL